MSLVDTHGNPPHSSATHYIRNDGDTLWFVKIDGEGRYTLLNSDGVRMGRYTEDYLTKLGYVIYTLKSLEELMEEYLSEKT